MDFDKIVPASNSLANYMDLNADVLVTQGMNKAIGLLFKRAYDRGFVGCFTKDGPGWARRIETYESHRFAAECQAPHSLLDQLTGKLQDGEGKRGPPLSLALRFDERALRGRQNFGNCTACSLGWDALNMLRACLITLKGEAMQFGVPSGTALIYGSRGHRGQGMALSTAANIVSKYGPSLRRAYCDGTYDCRGEDADENLGNRWGGSGPPSDFREECKADGRVTKVGSLGRIDKKTLRDLLYSNVMIHHGGRLTGTRSGSPLCRLTGVGPHAQTTLTFDDTEECKRRLTLPDGEFVVFNQQSWGDYYSISNWLDDLWGPYVPGTWPIKASDAVRVINQGSYGYYEMDGLKPLDLDWGDSIP